MQEDDVHALRAQVERTEMECPALNEATKGVSTRGVLTVTWDVHTSTPGAEVPARNMA